MVIRNVLIRNKLVLRNPFQWPIVNLLHKDKEHLVLRNNFRVTKKFLFTKFDYRNVHNISLWKTSFINAPSVQWSMRKYIPNVTDKWLPQAKLVTRLLQEASPHFHTVVLSLSFMTWPPFFNLTGSYLVCISSIFLLNEVLNGW